MESIDNNVQSKISGAISNSPVKLYPNLYLLFAKVFEKFISLFEQVIPCSLQNHTIEILFQIQYYSIQANANYNCPFHGKEYVDGEYIDAGGIDHFYKIPNASTRDIFEIATYREKKSRVEIEKGTCIVFENNIDRVNHRLKTVQLTDENNDGIIGKHCH